MTDKDIIKALEICIVDGCDICPCREEASCVRAMADNALDLINRQQAEIDYWKQQAFNGCMEREASIKIARAEAIKEFEGKQMPKKLIVKNFKLDVIAECPSCKHIFGHNGLYLKNYLYCYRCGQKLDWGEKDDR